jgi:hypothetical protein
MATDDVRPRFEVGDDGAFLLDGATPVDSLPPWLLDALLYDVSGPGDTKVDLSSLSASDVRDLTKALQLRHEHVFSWLPDKGELVLIGVDGRVRVFRDHSKEEQRYDLMRSESICSQMCCTGMLKSKYSVWADVSSEAAVNRFASGHLMLNLDDWEVRGSVLVTRT